jgi:hypothetical protein
MAIRPASLVIEEKAITNVGVRLRDDVEVLSVGPIVVSVTDGILAMGGGAILACSDVAGQISACPVRIAGELFITLQIDVVHEHQGLRVAGSFAVKPADFEQLLSRLQVPLAIAKLEADA